jgi:aspartate carbamoyltransferase catalytic subunit
LSNPFFNHDVTSIKDFSRSDLDYLFQFSDKIQMLSFRERKEIAEGRLLGLMFFEPSTRTRLSFEAAMHSVGGETISIIEPRTSSLEKGENLHDTIKTLESYTDILVLRHPNEGAARFAAQIAVKPIINGGSGSEEHPTQAMLDIYTMLKEKKSLSNLKIALVGDLKYSRTVHSLIFGLSLFNTRIFLVSPPELKIKDEVLIDVEGKSNISYHKEIEEIIGEIDVLYATRIQKERFPDPLDYEKVKGSYSIDNQLIMQGREDLMVMHPLPRTNEIKYEVDSTPNAKYFVQTLYGKIVRSALLALILNKKY